MARQWILTAQDGFKTSLQYQENISVPSPNELGPRDVLVRIYAASLNYRELEIARPSLIGNIALPIIPGCDGAGIVEAVGSDVQDFRPGDKVVTHVSPKHVEAHGDDAPVGLSGALDSLGLGTNGTLRSLGVFSEYGLVHGPKSLSLEQTSTLTCTWLTAWNALFGLESKKPGPGSFVLIQGTGGVSIAALQIAVAVGATVVATSSTAEKQARLKELGATHVLDYRTSPKWGEEARKLTPGDRGFDIILDVAGNESLPHSLAVVRVEGVIVVIGHVGAEVEVVPLFSVLLHTCIVRGILGGTRTQFREMIRFIDERKIVPVIDDVVFELSEAKEAYAFLEEKKHFSKIVIRIDHSAASA
ncbi:hypothetical protein N7478_007533 [Penicillium angulare]|uniref:uncharacterized protein n=1 Tax=Penicillium angulare TaxID=116970 RepID=UPI002541769E|nr:uncharacterized protein N7478_007533 [Penicillium angulare]KAJ5272408.1 hypothetical protein N7478_007533 [Penicillium angulare]